MKKLSLLVICLTGLAFARLHAQSAPQSPTSSPPSKTAQSAKTTQSAKTAKSSSQLRQNKAAAAGPVASVSVGKAQEGKGQSSVKASELFKTKSPWSGEYMHWITDVGSGETINYLKLNYAVADDLVVSAVPAFSFDYKWGNREVANWGLLDSYLQLAKSGAFALPGESKGDVAGRLYLPLSSSSRDKGTQGRLYGAVMVASKINSKVNASLASAHSYYQQSRENFTDGKGKVKANVRYAGAQVAEFSYEWNEKYSCVGSVQLENTVLVNGERNDVFNLDASVVVTFDKALAMQIGVTNSRPAYNVLQLGGSPQTNTAYLIATGTIL